MSLVTKTLRGTAWAYISMIGGRLIVFVSVAILARLLEPEDFGLLELALVVMGIFEATNYLGLNEALIYHSKDVEKASNTVFLINLGQGVLFTGLSISVAPLAGMFFEDPAVVPVLRALSWCFFLASLGRTHDALVQKEMAFRRRFWSDFIAGIVKGGTGVVLALMGYGVWSLVIGQMASCLARSVVNWIILPWRPHFRYYPEVARDLWGYGVKILIFNALGIAADKVDETVIGKLLGGRSLGFYSQANKIPALIVINFSMVLTQVLFPTYAKLKDDVKRLSQGFLLTTKYTAFVTVPASLGLFLIAPEFVRLVYGPKWDAAVPLMQVLSITTLWLTLAWTAGDVYKATGRPGLMIWLMLIELAVAIPALLAGAWFDRNGYTAYMGLGATTGSSLGYLFGTVLRLAVVARLLKIRFGSILVQFIPSFVAGGAMFAALLALRSVLPELPPLVLLIVTVATGGVIYVGVLFVLAREAIQTAWQAIKDALRRDGPAEEMEVLAVESPGMLGE